MQNSRLVFAPGNQWLREGDAAPFFGIPAWWRRFMFQVLSPRDITVYLYMCSVMDPNAISYPTPAQIAEDMAIRSRSVVVDSLNKLVEHGFLLRADEPYRGRYIGKRVLYQRPLPHFTILCLLKAGLIDAELFPTKNKARNPALTRASDEVVRSGLRRLIGKAAFAAYEHMKNPDRRRRVLIQALEEKMATIAPEPVQRTSKPADDVLKMYDELSDALKQIVDQEVQIPF